MPRDPLDRGDAARETSLAELLLDERPVPWGATVALLGH
jgi:hypothetical protein